MKVKGNVSQVFDTKYFGAFMLNCKKNLKKEKYIRQGKNVLNTFNTFF